MVSYSAPYSGLSTCE
jgi:F-type H+-transporting ATPase subunit alpha